MQNKDDYHLSMHKTTEPNKNHPFFPTLITEDYEIMFMEWWTGPPVTGCPDMDMDTGGFSNYPRSLFTVFCNRLTTCTENCMSGLFTPKMAKSLCPVICEN